MEEIIEIQELPDYLRSTEEAYFVDLSQLSYVVEMVEKICPNIGFLTSPFYTQTATAIFLKRYFDGSIDTSFKERYLGNKELQDSLKALGIDPSAFWYLILFLKDYVDDESTGPKVEDNAYTQVYNLAAKLNEMDFQDSPFDDGRYEGCKNEGILTIKVGKKHGVTISDDKALYGIFTALCNYLRSRQPQKRKELIDGVLEEVNEWDIYPEDEHLFNKSLRKEPEVISIPATYKIRLIRQMRSFYHVETGS